MFTADRVGAYLALKMNRYPDAAEKVKEETEDPGTMLQKVFPKLQCYDCEHCPLAGIHCEYPEAAKILRKLDRAMQHSTVSQEELLASLKQTFTVS